MSAFGDTHDVRVQLPLTLNAYSEPEPDFAIVSLSTPDVGPRHPSTADLVLEIADSTLTFDRAEKARLYAKSGIPDYWVVNLRHHRLEVHRQPLQDPELAWKLVTILGVEDSISPLCRPEITFSVAELLGA